MEQAGVRRIKRDIRIDVRSITFLTPELLDRISKKPFMDKWHKENSEEIKALKEGEATSLTNLGAFRAYITDYLLRHKNIDSKLPVMVRDMPTTETGMPVEIYCFSRINQWVPYEAVQSAIMDYIFAVVGQFGLKTFQNPAGTDFETLKK